MPCAAFDLLQLSGRNRKLTALNVTDPQMENSNYQLLRGSGEQDRHIKSWRAPADKAG
jgi:hypothetical protein